MNKFFGIMAVVFLAGCSNTIELKRGFDPEPELPAKETTLELQGKTLKIDFFGGLDVLDNNSILNILDNDCRTFHQFTSRKPLMKYLKGFYTISYENPTYVNSILAVFYMASCPYADTIPIIYKISNSYEIQFSTDGVNFEKLTYDEYFDYSNSIPCTRTIDFIVNKEVKSIKLILTTYGGNAKINCNEIKVY